MVDRLPTVVAFNPATWTVERSVASRALSSVVASALSWDVVRPRTCVLVRSVSWVVEKSAIAVVDSLPSWVAVTAAICVVLQPLYVGGAQRVEAGGRQDRDLGCGQGLGLGVR